MSDDGAYDKDVGNLFQTYLLHTGTQHGRNKSDPNYHTTNSQIPHLPFVSGFYGTAGTYRFLVVSTQTATIIGEGKVFILSYLVFLWINGLENLGNFKMNGLISFFTVR